MWEELEQIFDQFLEAKEAHDAVIDVMTDAFRALKSANTKYGAAVEALAKFLGRVADNSEDGDGVVNLLGGGSKSGLNLPGIIDLGNMFGDLF